MEGLNREQGHIRVDDFLQELQLLKSALKKASQHVHRESHFRLINLSHSSPVTVVLEECPTEPAIIPRGRTVSTFFFSVLKAIRDEGVLPERVSHSWLRDLSNMANPVGKTVSSVRISSNGTSIDFDRALQQKIKELLGPEETCPGAIRGMLEAINLHGTAKVFRIYPDVGPTKVTCHFPAKLQNDAVEALGHFVEVRGLLKYKVSAPYPHEVQVASIEAFPDEADLPRLSDLRGVAPRATGDMLSEAFIRGLRHATD